MMNKQFFVTLSLLIVFSISYGQQKTYSFSLEEAISHAIDSNYTAINARRDIAKAIKQKWEVTAAGLPQINANISVIFGTEQNANAIATLNQLIFDGSYLVGLQAAKAFLDFSKNSNEKIQLEIRKGIINAYGSVLLSEELIRIFEKNKTNVEKNVFEIRKIFENGLAEEESVEQLEITLLEIKTQLNNAKRTERIAQQMFNIALGIPVDSQVTLTEDLNTLTNKNIQLQLLDNTLNIEENIDYKIAYNFTEQRSLEMKLEKSRTLPTLSAFINYGTAANSDSFTFLNREQVWFQSSALGFNLSIPIFSSGGTQAKIKRTQIALEQAQIQLKETIQNIKLQINQAKGNYQFAIDNYNNSKKNLALAQRIEEKNQVKFKEGIGSSSELRLTQVQLYSAQQQYFQSMLNVITAKAEIETILNTPQLK